MHTYINHGRGDESLEEKVLWYRSLTIEERLKVFSNFMEHLTATEPALVEIIMQEKEEGMLRKGAKIIKLSNYRET